VKTGSAGQRKEGREKEGIKEGNERTNDKSHEVWKGPSFPSRDFGELICENRKAIAAPAGG